MFISDAFLKTRKPPPLMFSCLSSKLFESAVEHPETAANTSKKSEHIYGIWAFNDHAYGKYLWFY